MPEYSVVIDAEAFHVLPSVMDTHVHLRDPNNVEWEDRLTGTKAAAAYGVTIILEMPIAIPHARRRLCGSGDTRTARGRCWTWDRRTSRSQHFEATLTHVGREDSLAV